MEGCPVLVKLNPALSDLGWVELHCPICLANCSDSLAFFSGIAGIQCHMSKKHEKTPINKEYFSHKSIVEKGLLQRHSEDTIEKFKVDISNGQDPITRFQGRAMAVTKRTERSLTKVSGMISAEESVLSAESALSKHSNPDARDQRDTSNPILEDQSILVDENYPIICSHYTRGSIEIFCAYCKGNAVKDTVTNELTYLSGPLGLYTHLRQVHEDPSFYTLAVFERGLLDSTSPHIRRDWGLEAADSSNTVQISLEEISPMTQVAENTRDSPDKFLYLDVDHPTIVVREDGKWVDLRCPVVGCGANCTSTGSKRKAAYFKGISGLDQHLRRLHDIHAPAGTAKWQWLVQECTKWTDQPVVDIRFLKKGDIPMIPAPQKDDVEGIGKISVQQDKLGMRLQNRYV